MNAGFTWSLLALGVLAGCDDKGDDSGSTGDLVLATDSPTLSDDNNYNFSGGLSISSTQVTEREDALVDWSALQEDFQGHEVDPADIDQLGLVVFRYLSQGEVEDKLSTDTLQQSDIGLFVQYVTEEGDTETNISDFGLLGNDIDVEKYFRQDYGTWLLLLGEGLTPGTGTGMLKFVEPTPDIDEHQVEIDSDSATLTFEVDLASLDPVAVTTDLASVQWHLLTTDGRGNELDQDSLDQLWLAHYPGMSTADLEDGFLDLELITDEIFTQDITGLTEAELADFDGYTGLSKDDGTWLLALRCSTCVNPAPPFLTVLDVQ